MALFGGPTPEEMRLLLDQQDRQRAMGVAQMAPGRGRVAAMGLMGSNVGNALGQAFGGQRKGMKKPEDMKKAMEITNSQGFTMGSPEYFEFAAKTLAEMGYPKESMAAMKEAQAAKKQTMTEKYASNRDARAGKQLELQKRAQEKLEEWRKKQLAAKERIAKTKGDKKPKITKPSKSDIDHVKALIGEDSAFDGVINMSSLENSIASKAMKYMSHYNMDRDEAVRMAVEDAKQYTRKKVDERWYWSDKEYKVYDPQDKSKEVESRFKADKDTKGYTLGKRDGDKYEVLDKNGKLIGYYE